MKRISKKLWAFFLSFAFVLATMVSPIDAYAESGETLHVNEQKGGCKKLEGIEVSTEEFRSMEEQFETIEQGMICQVYDSNEYAGYASWYCRNHMNSVQAAFYDNLYHMANTYLVTTENIPYYSEYEVYVCKPISYSGLSYEEAEDLVYLFLFQNPQFYFLSHMFIYNSTEKWISLCPYYNFTDGYTRSDITSQFFSKIDNWITQINGYSNDYSKLLKAQNIVCDNAENSINEYDQSAYSVVFLGETTCAGYTKFYSLLTNGAGFDCVGVTSEDMAWNVVNLDGSYYNVDTAWDDNVSVYSTVPGIEWFLTSDEYLIEHHVRSDIYKTLAPACNSNHSKHMKRTIDSDGIFVTTNDSDHVYASMDVLKSLDEDIEYRWIACDKSDNIWFEVQGWIRNDEWVDWYPEKSGNYVLMCQARSSIDYDVYVEKSVDIEFHEYIKGKCQMPYTGEGGGYLIGFETYDNPNGQYRYEMLILDCTLLAEGKDAWIYTTGQCLVPETSFWTVWQPLYGYYWTLFRVYDADGNLIDEACYGFENIC